MANLQITGVDDTLYGELKRLAADENRSVSQQALFLMKEYLTKKKQMMKSKTSAQSLLDLAGAWEDERTAEEIILKIRLR